MKVRRCVLTGSFLIASVAWSTASFAYTYYNHNFWLQNYTDRTIIGAWLSTPGDGNWHAISGEVIKPHTSVPIVFDYQNGPCQTQLKIEFSDHSFYSWIEGFNVCAITHIRIYWDDDNGGYEASYWQ